MSRLYAVDVIGEMFELLGNAQRKVVKRTCWMPQESGHWPGDVEGAPTARTQPEQGRACVARVSLADAMAATLDLPEAEEEGTERHAEVVGELRRRRPLEVDEGAVQREVLDRNLGVPELELEQLTGELRRDVEVEENGRTRRLAHREKLQD